MLLDWFPSGTGAGAAAAAAVAAVAALVTRESVGDDSTRVWGRYTRDGARTAVPMVLVPLVGWEVPRFTSRVKKRDRMPPDAGADADDVWGARADAGAYVWR